MPPASEALQDNPYAPPRTADSSRRHPRVVRRGSSIHLFDGATLPPRCIKCNAPARQPLKRHTLHSSQIAVLRRKRARLAIGLCRRHARTRTCHTLFVCAVTLAGTACLSAGIGSLRSIGFALLLIAPVAGLFTPRTLRLSYVSDSEIRLKGAKKPFLESLPQE